MRATSQKYHSPLPDKYLLQSSKEGESNIEVGSRRLFEEMGFRTDLKELHY
jgi:isopentenyl-diphosphate delta-isomerase